MKMNKPLYKTKPLQTQKSKPGIYEKIALRQGWIICIAFSILFLIRETVDIAQIIYMVPFMAVIGWFANGALTNKFYYDKRSAKALVLYLLTVGLTLFSFKDFNFFYIRDVAIIAGLFITFFFPAIITEGMVKFIFVVYALNKFIQTIVLGELHFGLEELFIHSMGGGVEGDSYQFGVFALYFLYKRNLTWTLLSISFTFLAFKRITIIALFGALVTILILTIFVGRTFDLSKRSNRFKIGTFGFAVAFVAFNLAINLEIITRWFLDMLGYKDLSTDYFLMGRVNMHKIIYDDMELNNVLKTLFGHGPGMADNLLYTTLGYRLNPHNDVLKMIYEYGYVGMVLCWYSFWVFISRNLIGVTIFVFSTIIYLTDNSLIYYPYKFVAIAVVLASMSEAQKSKTKGRNLVVKRAGHSAQPGIPHSKGGHGS